MWFWSVRVSLSLVVEVTVGIEGRFSQVGVCLITRLFVRRIRVGLDPG